MPSQKACRRHELPYGGQDQFFQKYGAAGSDSYSDSAYDCLIQKADMKHMENSNDQSLTLVFTVNQTPEQVFVAINNVRGWWTGKIDGSAEKLGDEFAYRYKDLHFSKQKVTELIPGKKVVWHVLDASLEFAKDKKEWVGTDIVFEILKVGDKTEVRFTHQGLVPQFECYDACFEGWSFYIRGTLPKLIASGKNQV